jgi:hypothetical protein
MTKEERVTTGTAPAPRPPASEQHRRDQQLFEQTRDSITTRLVSFAQEFEQLAETAWQGVQAERCQVAVRDLIENEPLTAADFSLVTNFPG